MLHPFSFRIVDRLQIWRQPEWLINCGCFQGKKKPQALTCGGVDIRKDRSDEPTYRRRA
jgi:hypothetical protein